MSWLCFSPSSTCTTNLLNLTLLSVQLLFHFTLASETDHHLTHSGSISQDVLLMGDTSGWDWHFLTSVMTTNWCRFSHYKIWLCASDGKVKLHEASVVFVEPSRWSSLFNKGLKASDGKVKLHEALVVFVHSSRWRSLFKEGGSMNGNSVCFQPF